MKTIDKPCEICGEMMHNVTGRRRCCDKCYKERQKGYFEKCIRLKKEKAEKEEKKKENNLTETAQKAREKGLSYGKYVALYGS